jgi:hypothetical protein
MRKRLAVVVAAAATMLAMFAAPALALQDSGRVSTLRESSFGSAFWWLGLVLVVAACADTAPSSSIQNTTSTLSLGGTPAEPHEDLISDALDFYRDRDLPDSGLPPGFLEIDLLQGECIASFGIDVLEIELARESGVYYFNATDQPDRVDRVAEACTYALAQLGALLPANPDSQKMRYDALVQVHECLERHGYLTTSPPSLETFIENPDEWSPWEGMIGNSGPILPTEQMKNSEGFRDYFSSLEDCPRP